MCPGAREGELRVTTGIDGRDLSDVGSGRSGGGKGGTGGGVMGPDGARCGKLLRRGGSVGGFVEEMSGFGGEGNGDDLGHAVADGIGFGIVVVEMGEEGGENGAGFFAGALVDVVLGAGGRGGGIGGGRCHFPG